MTKIIYNVLSILMSCALVMFIGHCINCYQLYGMSEPLVYAAISAVSIVVLLTNLVFGGKKNEAKH